MSERPILFSGPMVRAIRDGKTQTRRMVKPQPDLMPHHDPVRPEPRNGGRWVFMTHTDRPSYSWATGHVRCPYGQPGDRLIVKEAAWVWCRKEQDGLTRTGRPKFRYISLGRFVHYQATEEKPTYRVNSAPDQGWRLKIGRYLPRWASRITLEVLGVRVERLQDISEEDARAEGVALEDGQWTDEDGTLRSDYRTAFRRLWISINGQDSWDANPWVWVVEFRRLP